MGTRYIRSWEDLEEAVKDKDQIEDGDDLIFQIAGEEITATVVDRSRSAVKGWDE